MISRVVVGYCNAFAVTTVGKADSVACPNGTVVVATVAANVATSIVAVDIAIATTDVDSGNSAAALSLLLLLPLSGLGSIVHRTMD